mgnify:CR=1 FL=1
MITLKTCDNLLIVTRKRNSFSTLFLLARVNFHFYYDQQCHSWQLWGTTIYISKKCSIEQKRNVVQKGINKLNTEKLVRLLPLIGSIYICKIIIRAKSVSWTARTSQAQKAVYDNIKKTDWMKNPIHVSILIILFLLLLCIFTLLYWCGSFFALFFWN